MGRAFGKTLERVGRSSFLELVFVLVMVDAQDFDGTFGLVILS